MDLVNLTSMTGITWNSTAMLVLLLLGLLSCHLLGPLSLHHLWCHGARGASLWRAIVSHDGWRHSMLTVVSLHMWVRAAHLMMHRRTLLHVRSRDMSTHLHVWWVIRIDGTRRITIWIYAPVGASSTLWWLGPLETLLLLLLLLLRRRGSSVRRLVVMREVLLWLVRSLRERWLSLVGLRRGGVW